MQLFVEPPSGPTLTLTCAAMGDLSRQLEQRTGISVREQRLTFAGRPLSGNARLLHICGVRSESTIELTLRLRGGSDDGAAGDDDEEEEEEDDESDVDALELVGGGSDSATQRSRAPKRKRAPLPYEGMPYKKLQALCKKQRLKAAGKKVDLVARLLAYHDAGDAGSDASGTAANAARPVGRSGRVAISGAAAASLAAPVAPPPQRSPAHRVRTSRHERVAIGGAPAATPVAAAELFAQSSAAVTVAAPGATAGALPPAAELFAQIFDAAIVPQSIEMFNDPGGTIHSVASLFGEDISLDPAVLASMMRRLAFVGLQNGVDIATGAGVINEWVMLAEEMDNSFTNVYAHFCGRFEPLDPCAEELQLYIDGRKRGGAATASGVHRKLCLLFPPGHTKGVGRRGGTYPDNILEPWCVDVRCAFEMHHSQLRTPLTHSV